MTDNQWGKLKEQKLNKKKYTEAWKAICLILPRDSVDYMSEKFRLCILTYDCGRWDEIPLTGRPP